MDLKDYKSQWKRLSIKKTLIGVEALEAVKNDGYALQYVKEEFFQEEI
jgi:hypothetical protein